MRDTFLSPLRALRGLCEKPLSQPPSAPSAPERSLVSDDSRFVASPDQISCDLGGEAAILHLKTAIYYGLDPVGARVWDLLRTPRTLAEIRDAILAEYDVEPDRCERDLRDLLEKLAAERLIEILAEPSS